jgi:addiction module HigA family antidote
MAYLLQMAAWRGWTFQCRDCPMSRLSIIIEERWTMSRPAIHPGEILAEELAVLELTPTELARQLKVPANRITQIIQGKRSISGDTALRLGHWFGTSGTLVWHRRPILAQSSKRLRFVSVHKKRAPKSRASPCAPHSAESSKRDQRSNRCRPGQTSRIERFC